MISDRRWFGEMLGVNQGWAVSHPSSSFDYYYYLELYLSELYFSSHLIHTKYQHPVALLCALPSTSTYYTTYYTLHVMLHLPT